MCGFSRILSFFSGSVKLEFFFFLVVRVWSFYDRVSLCGESLSLVGESEFSFRERWIERY